MLDFVAVPAMYLPGTRYHVYSILFRCAHPIPYFMRHKGLAVSFLGFLSRKHNQIGRERFFRKGFCANTLITKIITHLVFAKTRLWFGLVNLYSLDPKK